MESDPPNGYGRPVQVQPVILPPGYDPQDGYRPPVREIEPPPERRRPGWSYAPATYVLVAINCVVFAAMVLNHVSPLAPTIDQLLAWGANNGSLVMLHGELWRLLTAAFVHV